MSETNDLMSARDRCRERFHGIGEPVVDIPLEFIGVFKDSNGIHHATISYLNLVALVELAKATP